MMARRGGSHGVARQKLFNRWVIIVIALVLVAGITGVVVTNLGSDNSTVSTPPSALPTIGLTGSGAQLATLLNEAHNHLFHARYKVSGDPSVIGGTLTLEWWNQPGHSRVDTIRSDGNQHVHTASLVNGGDGANCQQVDGGAWSCQAIAVPGPGDPGGIIGSLTAQLGGRSVTVRSDNVGTRTALCFHVGASSTAEAIDVCVNSDGVLLRNQSSNVTYELTSLDTTIPAKIFDPLATVK